MGMTTLTVPCVAAHLLVAPQSCALELAAGDDQ